MKIYHKVAARKVKKKKQGKVVLVAERINKKANITHEVELKGKRA